MIKIIESSLFKTHKLSSYIFASFLGCLNADNNRLEIHGKAMNSVDLCAYLNVTMQELSRGIRELYGVNAILTIRAKGKEFYYINPNYMREESRDIFSFEWLLELFEEEANEQDKELVYFKKDKRKISVNIGESILKVTGE
jgi:hypothetical protein